MKCLGIVVHFINTETFEVQNAALDLVEIERRSTSDNLRELANSAIKSFGLNTRNIVKVVSDGASTMRRAFLYVNKLLTNNCIVV